VGPFLKNMSIKFTIIILAALVVSLLGSLIFFSPGEHQAPADPPTTHKFERPNPEPSSPESTGSKKELDSATSAQKPEAKTQNEKEAVLAMFFEATATPTEENVRRVAPYLLSPDLEVRDSAVEAMKQLSLPSAAKALRDASTRTSSPSDKATLLEAAEFIELPPYIPRSQRMTNQNE
jgi:hypothetical protein